MLSPEVIEAKKVQEDYKRLNLNTVKVVSRIDPKMKCRYYETVKVDENAGQFAQLYKEKKKVNKQNKHLGKQLMNAPKPKKEKVTQVKKEISKKYNTKGTTEDRKERMLQCFNLHTKGYSTSEIAESLAVTYSTARKDLTDYCKENGITMLGDASVRVLKFVLQGMHKKQIMEQLKVTDKAVLFHFRKLLKYYPDLEINKEPRKKIYTTVRTETVQRLLKEGKSISEIGDIMNIKEKNVKDNIRRYKKKMGTFIRESNSVNSEEVKELLDSGLNRNEVAKELNVAWKTVQYHFEKLENKL